jgi:hypothetical protein
MLCIYQVDQVSDNSRDFALREMRRREKIENTAIRYAGSPLQDRARDIETDLISCELKAEIRKNLNGMLFQHGPYAH